ncbi:MAG: hypothetical protein WAT71_17970 [Ignavibacteria bacterium]
MSLKDVNIKNVNKLKLQRVDFYKQSKNKKLSKEIVKKFPKFLKPDSPADNRNLISELTELFSLELVAINGVELTDEQKYLYDERAGIYEYEAGILRAEAEDRAIKELKHLIL